MTMHRAYSLIECKDVSEDQRIIRGIATSPVPDREGDIVDPFGVTVAADIPLFLYHDSTKTVGRASFGKPTSKGIPFEARIPKVTEPGILKDRVDEAWQMVKHGLITAVSIGFRTLGRAYEQIQDGGLKFLQTEVLELSLVPVPAQPAAVIQGFKSMGDDAKRAALIQQIKSIDTASKSAASGALPVDQQAAEKSADGHPPDKLPGVSGTPKQPARSGLFYVLKGKEMKIQEQIASLEKKRQCAIEQKQALVEKSIEEGRTFDEHEREQNTQFASEIHACDEHIKTLKDHEALMVAKAVHIDADSGKDSRGHAEVRGGYLSTKSNLPPGIAFTRFSLAMARAKGNVMLAHEIAKADYKDSPQVINALNAAISIGSTKALHEKAAVTVSSTSDSASVGPLVQYQDMERDFVELLRPKMILGRLTQLHRTDFMTRAARQLTGVSGSFVGEGLPKPVGRQTYDNTTLGFAKVAVIVVMTEEAARFSSPSAEVKARDDMIKGIATYIDKRFIDPSYSGVANVSPASITNAATRIQSSGTTLAAIDADVRNAFAMFATSDVDPSTAVWIMPASVALRLSMKRTTDDTQAFPELSMQGGTWYGLPVIVSNAMLSSGSPSELQIALVTQEEVSLADDENVSIDMSTEASVQMNDAPSAGAQSLVSLWQNNLLGIRAERYINWGARRPSNLGIALIENTNY